MKRRQEHFDQPDRQPGKSVDLKDKPKSSFSSTDSDRIDVLSKAQVDRPPDQDDQEEYQDRDLKVVEEAAQNLHVARRVNDASSPAASFSMARESREALMCAES